MFYFQSIVTRRAPVLMSLILALILPLAVRAQDTTAAGKTESRSQVSETAPNSPANLLPEVLGGLTATSETKEYKTDNLRELAPEIDTVLREYRVIAAASRDYGNVKAEIFQTQNQFAAFGLFSFVAGRNKGLPGMEAFGQDSALISHGVVFWKSNVLVRLRDTRLKASIVSLGLGHGWTSGEKLARMLSEAIVSPNAGVKYPPLLDSLPSPSKLSGSEQYFLGAESLSAGVVHGREMLEFVHGPEMFEFVGETEAVTADYKQSAASVIGSPTGPSANQAVPDPPAKNAAPAPENLPLTLIIVECHTPEFATDELARVTGYVSSLPDDEQQRIVFKRTGNYIIAGVNVSDREFAEGLISSIQYPYTVKWLRNPLWPTNDPFRTQKAAQMLLSTFGLLGLIILTVILGGSIFGATVFLKRRKQQREIFSDAGGMLRLDIEPFVLALPPKRDK